MSKVYQVECEYDGGDDRRTSVFSTREKAEDCLKSALLKELEEYLEPTNDPKAKMDDLKLPQVERLLHSLQRYVGCARIGWNIEEKTMDKMEREDCPAGPGARPCA